MSPHCLKYSHYHLPEFFAVQIGTDADTDEVAKQIIVEVINRPMIKPFLGGYLNKQTCKLINYY